MCMRNRVLGIALLSGGAGLFLGMMLCSPLLETVIALALLAAGVIILTR